MNEKNPPAEADGIPPIGRLTPVRGLPARARRVSTVRPWAVYADAEIRLLVMGNPERLVSGIPGEEET